MKKQRPAQKQSAPGTEIKMTPTPLSEKNTHVSTDRLKGKIALITGGDSGIGKAVAILFAKEGADIAVSYLNEHKDAESTAAEIREEGRKVLLFPGDIGQPDFCNEIVTKTVDELGGIDIVINNAAEQHPQEDPLKITPEQLEKTFRTNIFSYFYITLAALPHLKSGSSIINTTSVTAYRGSSHLIDYSATKGAIVSFTRSLSANLASKKIRVNAVAPGPIWTPLIPSTFPPDEVAKFGADVPLGRAGQPAEVAPSYLFLATDDSSYMTGQVLHPNGGEIING